MGLLKHYTFDTTYNLILSFNFTQDVIVLSKVK